MIFDIDGTVVDSVKQHQKAFSESLLEIGVRELKSNYGSFLHHTDSFICKEIYEADRKEPFSKEKKRQFELGLTDKISCQRFTEIAGAKVFIEKLKTESEYGVCFATGSLKNAAKHKLKSIGIEFEKWQLVASDDIYEREGILKEAIEKALSFYEVKEFERIISVGDGLWDLLTAQNLGVEFIGIGAVNKKVQIENGANLVCEDFRELEFKMEEMR